ncbi:hypothetical protein BT93_H1307 [Corymbia citriodora subsp. variegata]|nr:hypothetical protein BT93_H1307 [Corymbia citriodora subsp. variegata]
MLSQAIFAWNVSCAGLRSAAQPTAVNVVNSSFTSHVEFSMLSTLGHPFHLLPGLDRPDGDDEEDRRSCHACERASLLPFGWSSITARPDIALSE